MAGDPNGSGTENGRARGATRSRPIRVLIVDDERTFGEALQVALGREKDLRIVHVATDGEQALEAVSEHQPDVVIMDVGMPGMSGIEATRRIREADPNARVLIHAIPDDEHLLARAVQAGAIGFVPKTEGVGQVASSVRRVHRGEPLHDDQEVEAALRRFRHRRSNSDDVRHRLNRLTPREIQVLTLMAEGRSAVDIVGTLRMSPHTLRTHTQNVLTKLGVHSKTEALMLAIRHGKVPLVDLTSAEV